MTRKPSKPAARRPRSTRTRANPAESRSPEPAERTLKIGEAAQLLGVETYVLRFWETQFPFLRPRHARSKHRQYEAKDLEALKVIKRLLHTEGFTIAGAKKHIRETGLERLTGSSEPSREARAASHATAPVPADRTSANLTRTLAVIREDLQSLQRLLRG